MIRTLPLRRLQGLAAFAAGAAVTLALASPAAALNQARIHGTITDENKKPLEGVDVLVTCPEITTIRLETRFNPTFVPLASALDQRSGASPFAATFTAKDGLLVHGAFPDGAVPFLLKELTGS